MSGMHTIWKGSISFGLVNIPIKLFAATENHDIKMRSLHKECNNPIKYEKECPVCEREVQKEEIVKGYEYEPGKFVVIEDEELEAIVPQSNKRIEIIDFVKLEEIDPIYYDRSYFLGPNQVGEKSYALLKTAMEDTQKIGVAKITIRSKEQLAVVRVYGNSLLLETIHFPEEVRSVDLVPGLSEVYDLDQKELTMAKQLIEQLTTEFDPTKYHNEYRSALMDLIDQKVEGNDVTVAKEKSEPNVVDLMEALQASIDKTKPKKKKIVRKKKKAASE
jgi:DNA end-binding protein Ku